MLSLPERLSGPSELQKALVVEGVRRELEERDRRDREGKGKGKEGEREDYFGKK